MVATKTVVENNKAKHKGGALSVTNPLNSILPKTSVTFDKCEFIRMNRADWGGFAYYDN
jgi:predicted outer membrane repeat protein